MEYNMVKNRIRLPILIICALLLPVAPAKAALGSSVDATTSSFDGDAWAENAGWVHFSNAAPLYNVATKNYKVYLPVVTREPAPVVIV